MEVFHAEPRRRGGDCRGIGAGRHHSEIVDAAYKLHCSLGSGLLESVYETVLARDLERRGLRAARQVSVSFEYDRLIFEDAYRVDLMIENLVIVEVKSLECLHAVHAKQLLTYRRLLKLPVGLLINFGGATFKEGVQRVVNGLAPSASPRLCVNQMPETSTGL